MFQSVIEWLWSPERIIAVQNWFGMGWGWLFQTLTLFGATPGVATVIMITFWLAGRQLAYRLVGILVLAFGVDVALWYLVGVPRPDDPRIIVRSHEPVPSFPSGHTVSATTLWTTIALRTRLPLLVPIVIVPLVMLSRLYLGAHYLGDVLGGVIIGVLILLLFRQIWPTVSGWLEQILSNWYLVAGACLPLMAIPTIWFVPGGWLMWGAALGVGLGAPLEYCYVHYTPRSFAWRAEAVKMVIGLAGLGLAALGYWLLGAQATFLTALVVAAGLLWGLLLAPALFTWMGYSAS